MAKNQKPPNPIKFRFIENVKMYLTELKETYTYGEIAAAYQVNKGIIWKIINRDRYNPSKFENRLALGLSVAVLVQTVNGYIEPGSISLGSKSCDNCGQPFISNAGKRKLCYLCLKPRDRKAEAEKRKAKEDKNCWFCIECNKKIKGGFPHNGGHLCAGCLIKELEAQK